MYENNDHYNDYGSAEWINRWKSTSDRCDFLFFLAWDFLNARKSLGPLKLTKKPLGIFEHFSSDPKTRLWPKCFLFFPFIFTDFTFRHFSRNSQAKAYYASVFVFSGIPGIFKDSLVGDKFLKKRKRDMCHQ